MFERIIKLIEDNELPVLEFRGIVVAYNDDSILCDDIGEKWVIDKIKNIKKCERAYSRIIDMHGHMHPVYFDYLGELIAGYGIRNRNLVSYITSIRKLETTTKCNSRHV